ncbi:hypothetical protein NJ76_27925 [Rhodococcus sp. IITR03]|nr:hypothetical protein NJ76_27925 [Rhodococcus sp. IITR03]
MDEPVPDREHHGADGCRRRVGSHGPADRDDTGRPHHDTVHTGNNVPGPGAARHPGRHHRVDPCAVPTTTPPATTTTTPPPTTTTTPVVPAECVTTPAMPEPVTPTPASETVPEPAAPPVTAAQEPEPAPPAENTLEPLPAEMIPAAPAADQPITPDDPELSSKTAEPDLDWAPTENPNATLVPGRCARIERKSRRRSPRKTPTRPR